MNDATPGQDWKSNVFTTTNISNVSVKVNGVAVSPFVRSLGNDRYQIIVEGEDVVCPAGGGNGKIEIKEGTTSIEKVDIICP